MKRGAHRLIEPPRPARRVRPHRDREAPALAASSLLQILWLASPALPVGGFSYSEGFEAAVEGGCAADETAAGGWLVDQLHLVLARSDLPVIARGFAAWQRHDVETARELNGWVHATRETAELRQQTEQMGRSLAGWLASRPAPGTPDARIAALAAFAPAPTWPLAAALAAARSGAPKREALLALAFGWAENLVQAAVKAIPLGQSAGQRVLARLVEALPAAVDAAIALAPGERQAYAPMLAILSARHETQYSRLFRS